MYKFWLAAAAVCGLTGVGLSAYASHGLGFIGDPALRETARATLHTAVQQQMWHALALMGVGILAAQGWRSRWLTLAGSLFVAGVVLFSGLIYLRILGQTDVLRTFVPWGGTCLMLGWLSLGVAACLQRKHLPR